MTNSVHVTTNSRQLPVSILSHVVAAAAAADTSFLAVVFSERLSSPTNCLPTVSILKRLPSKSRVSDVSLAGEFLC